MPLHDLSGKEKPVEQREVETERAELRVTSEEARRIANLLATPSA
jgi:hypothetical protein